MADPVVFSYAVWVARFPEFAAIPQLLAQSYFDEATIVWRNNGTSPAGMPLSPSLTPAIQSVILNLITAHIAALYAQSQGQADPGGAQDANTPVGRIASASEGSVSVSADLGLAPSANAMQAWLTQTKYGFQAYAYMGTYRTMRYVPGMLQPGGFGWPATGPFGPGLGRYWRR